MNLKTSNFREIKIGKIPPSILYRSNHPIYNGKQVKDIISLVNTAKIKTVINLCDDIHSLKTKAIQCPWYNNKLINNDVIALNINRIFDVMDNKFHKKIKNAIYY